MPLEQIALAGPGFLSGGFTSGASSLTVRTAPLWPTSGNFRVQIDKEILQLRGNVSGSINWTILNQGMEGTAPQDHNDWASVAHIITPQGLKNQVGGITYQSGSSYTVSPLDARSLVYANASGGMAVSLPQATPGDTSNFNPNFFFTLYNANGTSTLTPASGTINKASSLSLQSGQWASVWSDGTNYAATPVTGGGASLTSGSVTSGYLGNASVVSGNIASGAIAASHLSSGTIIAGAGINITANANNITITNTSGAGSSLTSGSVTSGMLGNASVVSGSIASGSLAAAHHSSGFIIAGAGISVSANASNITITNTSGAGGSSSLTSGQVTSGLIGNASVVSGSIASGQIAASHLSSGTIIAGAGISVSQNANNITITNTSGAAGLAGTGTVVNVVATRGTRTSTSGNITTSGAIWGDEPFRVTASGQFAYTLVDSDRGSLLQIVDSASTITLPVPGGTSGFANGWYCDIAFTPAPLGNGIAPSTATLIVPASGTAIGTMFPNNSALIYPGKSQRLVSDGTRWQMIGDVLTGTGLTNTWGNSGQPQAQFDVVYGGQAGSAVVGNDPRINPQNYLINGGFWFAQRNTPTTETAITTGVNDHYGPDRWKMSNSLSGVASANFNYLRWDQLTSGMSSGLNERYYGSFVNATSGAKWAFYQPIEANTSFDLRNQTLTFQAKMKSPTSGTLVQFGILQTRSGAPVDTLPNQIATGAGGNWNTATSGTNPTWCSGITILASVNLCPQLTNNWQTISVTAAHQSGGTNLIPAIWANNAMASGTQIHVGEAGLYQGSYTQSWQPQTQQEELARCQRYYAKTFPVDVGAAQATNNYAGSIMALGVSGGGVFTNYTLPVEMLKSGTITTYNPVSANNKWRNDANTVDSSDVGTRVGGTGRVGVNTSDGNQRGWCIHLSVDCDI